MQKVTRNPVYFLSLHTNFWGSVEKERDNFHVQAIRAAGCDWYAAKEWEKCLACHREAQSAIDPAEDPVLIDVGTTTNRTLPVSYVSNALYLLSIASSPGINSDKRLFRGRPYS